LNEPRYGLPFAGDNNLLYDSIEASAEPLEAARWFTRMLPDDAPRKGSCRLTVGIDRADNSRTTAPLFAPLSEPTLYPPEDTGWVWVPRSPLG
jgi:CRISPR-associated protein Cas5t